MSSRLTERQLEKLIIQSGIANGKRAELGRWIQRGDGIAVYQQTGGSSLEFVSFGTRWAMVKFQLPPELLPARAGLPGRKDYRLVGYYKVG
jgi:hypothetical protein